MPNTNKLKFIPIARVLFAGDDLAGRLKTERLELEKQVTVRSKGWLRPDAADELRWYQTLKLGDRLVKRFGLRSKWAFLITDFDRRGLDIRWNAGGDASVVSEADRLSVALDGETWPEVVRAVTGNPARAFIELTKSHGSPRKGEPYVDAETAQRIADALGA